MKSYYVKHYKINVGDLIPSEFSQNISILENSLLFDYPCSTSVNCGPYYLYLPKGRYFFEVWGAQGGFSSSEIIIKRGGYSKGILVNKQTTLIYIFVGSSGTTKYGGYNGGGTVSPSSRYGFGGGGATDIRIAGDTYYHRVLVAGGSGGKEYGGEPAEGSGGGIEGSKGSGYDSTKGGTGGTQTSPGSPGGGFGYGGSSSLQDTGGGGGGWYGGGAGNIEGDGGGGSGFVFNSTNQNIVPLEYKVSSDYFLIEGDTISGLYSQPNPYEFDSEITYLANGVVRMTILNAKIELCTTSCSHFIFLFSIINYHIIIFK